MHGVYNINCHGQRQSNVKINCFATQVLSGYGCFGKYLYSIAKRSLSPGCHHCGCTEHSAQHTLAVYTAWAPQRRALATVIGGDLSLPAGIRSMAVSVSCEAVVSVQSSHLIHGDAWLSHSKMSLYSLCITPSVGLFRVIFFACFVYQFGNIFINLVIFGQVHYFCFGYIILFHGCSN